MGLFSNQFLNVVEWEEWREDMIFWKWKNKEIKKGSKLIIRPGQDAIFLNNGKIEGIFQDDGEYDIETQIIPFLSTLKGFKFGFNSGMRAEVLFVNTKEFTIKWGTKGPVMLPTPALPGGLPIRANGTANFKISDYVTLIDKVAGVKDTYSVDDVKLRITTVLDQLLMKWISKEGKDMFNLQANAFDISEGIKSDLDMQTSKDGISITGFSIMNFNYPEEVQQMITKNAAQAMVGDVNRYQTLTMTDAMADGKLSGGNSTMGNMAEMMMGMTMANQMMNNMNMNGQQPQQNMGMQQQPQQNMGMQQPQQGAGGDANIPKFCPNCGSPTNGAKFCANCGNKLA
jgi:membrane protease subunit (stomatin/prohibitin family)